MNEEIEYAEMLEIPVSTVNVVQKKRRIRGKNPPNLKDRLISRINNRVGADSRRFPVPRPRIRSRRTPSLLPPRTPPSRTPPRAPCATIPSSNEYAYREGGERLDTVLLSDAPGKKKKRGFFAGNDEGADAEADGYEYAVKTPVERRAGILLTAEFALACLLCGGIFLTNVFMPTSAINTFFRSLMPSETTSTDNRVYSDFELGSVVSELSDAELSVSPRACSRLRTNAAYIPRWTAPCPR